MPLPQLITNPDRLVPNAAQADRNALVTMRGRQQVGAFPEDRNYLRQQRQFQTQRQGTLDHRASYLFMQRAMGTIETPEDYERIQPQLVGQLGISPDIAMPLDEIRKDGTFDMFRDSFREKAEADEETQWTNPQSGTDDKGNPIIYRVNKKTGEPDIIKGVKPKIPKGMKIYDRDGNLMVDMSGGAGPEVTKKTKGRIEGKLVDGSEQLTRMLSIYDTWKPEYSEVGTRFQAAWTGTKAFLGIGVEEKDRVLLTEFKLFQRKAIENINLYIKELTGAQMSEKEADRLRLAMPDPGEKWYQGDDPITFKAKMDDVIKTTRASIARWNYYRSKNIGEKEIVEMINDGRAVSLDSLIGGMK